MKLWKKVYIITMLLSVLLINCGIYLVFSMTYEKDLNTERNRVKAEFQVIDTNITRDMEALEEQGRCGMAQLKSLMEIYENKYANKSITLKLWRDEMCIYPEEGKEREFDLFQKSKEKIIVFTKNGKKAICETNEIDRISNNNEYLEKEQDNTNGNIIDDTNQHVSNIKKDNSTNFLEAEKQELCKYYLYYEQPLTELEQVWAELEKKYIQMSVMVSIMLAFLLWIILQRLMKPVEELFVAVNRMKEGDYNNRVKIKGKDDIAVLGENFNQMAEIISENITHIKEEAKKKQEFIDNFAHELKTPLTTIYGFAEYVEKTNISEEEKEECMGFIMEESNRMLKLSYTLLDMAKLRENTIEMQFIDTNKLCQWLKQEMQDYCVKRGCDFSIQCKVEEIYGNELLIQSLLGNLVQNAILSCEKNGKVMVKISKKKFVYEIMVEDNGCGMTKEQTAHIMEPFYRVDKARSRENGGTGLGLSLCRQIVKVHKGQLTIDSVPQKGTVVIVSFS